MRPGGRGRSQASRTPVAGAWALPWDAAPPARSINTACASASGALRGHIERQSVRYGSQYDIFALFFFPGDGCTELLVRKKSSAAEGLSIIGSRTFAHSRCRLGMSVSLCWALFLRQTSYGVRSTWYGVYLNSSTNRHARLPFARPPRRAHFRRRL